MENAVCILGGGLAGLGAAHYLKKAGIRFEVYEASNRLGGRIWSRTLHYDNSEVLFEAGAETIDSSHVELLSLARDLNLQVEDLRSSSKAAEDEQFFVGGRRLRLTDFAEQLFELQTRAQARVRDLLGDPELASYFDNLSMQNYLDAEVPRGSEWLLELIATAYRGSMGLNARSCSALGFLRQFGDLSVRKPSVCGAEDRAFSILGGNSRIVTALARVLPDETIFLNHKLVEIREAGAKFELLFENGGVVQRCFDRIILAAPFSCLRKVKGIHSLQISDVQKQLIQELPYGSNSKSLLVFKDRFWKDCAAFQGDFPSETFWELDGPPDGRGYLVNYVGGEVGRDMTKENFRNVLFDLNTIFPVSEESLLGGEIVNWTQSEYSLGSYACPAPGQYEAFLKAQNSFAYRGRVVFAGEHTAGASSGTMNGALKSGVFAAEVISKAST